MKESRQSSGERAKTRKTLLGRSAQSLHDDLVLGHKRSRGFPSSVIGHEREVLVEALLSKVLPSFVRYGSGVIIDRSGAQTGQVDIVLETPHSLSLPLSHSRQRLYFADTVAAAIEVKSDLRHQQDEAFAKVSEIKSLRTRSLPRPGENESGVVMMQDYQIPTFIIAYRGPSEKAAEAIWHKQTRIRGNTLPTGILTIEPGFFDGFSPLGGGPSATGPLAILAFLLTLSEWIAHKATAGVKAQEYARLLNSDVSIAPRRN